MYFLWYQPRFGDTPEWSRMAYSGRSYIDCESLQDYYEREWGNHYSYVILPSSLEPKGRVAIR